MGYKFSYSGGVWHPKAHHNEKFLLFFLVGGKEIPFYQLNESGLVHQLEYGNPNYMTGNNICKIFVSQQGFGIPRMFYSFYINLMEGAYPIIRIRPFSGSKGDFFFEAKGRFLKQKQILDLLNDDNPSKPFVQKQGMLPVDVLRSMISLDRSELKKGVRYVRIGRKKV